MISKNKKRIFISLDNKLIKKMQFTLNEKQLSISDYVSKLIDEDLKDIADCSKLIQCKDCEFYGNCNK